MQGEPSDTPPECEIQHLKYGGVRPISEQEYREQNCDQSLRTACEGVASRLESFLRSEERLLLIRFPFAKDVIENWFDNAKSECEALETLAQDLVRVPEHGEDLA